MALRPIFYDTETTGVSAKKDRIIELAAFDPVREASYQVLIHPGFSIPAEATAIHHITNEMVKDAPSFKEITDDFTKFCEGDSVLIAHNNDGFDKHFMREEFLRSECELPDWKYLDTLKWARKYRPDLPRHSLQFLREIYGFEENNAHRALDDVMMLYKIFSAMTDDLDFDTVFSLMTNVNQQSSETMPFGKYQGKKFEEVPKDYLAWLLDSGALDKPQNEDLKSILIKKELLPMKGKPLV